jgi:hypothetical protein
MTRFRSNLHQVHSKSTDWKSRQTIQWPKEKGQKDKQLSTKHQTEN